MIKTELYFGTAIQKTSSVVSESAFQWFLNDYITPEFPEGLTIVQAQGQFQMNNGTIIYESSVIVILLHGGGLQEDIKIDFIREQFKRIFNQESVMRVDQQVSVSF